MIETPMIRFVWTEPARPELDDITVLICQNKTPDLIRLSLESLLTFYPTIKILVVNGTPQDEAGKWLRYKEARTPNLRVWDRVGYDSHGVAMHEAITQQIDTKFVLMMDSDVIVKRGGWIEDIRFDLLDLGSPPAFAAGSLMNVTNSNYAIGAPTNEADILRYIHPSCGMINREIYLQFLAKSNNKTAFCDHGAPCVYTMQYAQKNGYQVIGYPVADYVMHLSGASWTNPRTVWSNDFNVFIRPLVTFISDVYIFQADRDYDVIPYSNQSTGHYVIHGQEAKEINNKLFDTRLRITGDYVCVVEMGHYVAPDLVSRLRAEVTREPKDVIKLDSITFYTREYYQSNIAWIS